MSAGFERRKIEALELDWPRRSNDEAIASLPFEPRYFTHLLMLGLTAVVLSWSLTATSPTSQVPLDSNSFANLRSLTTFPYIERGLYVKLPFPALTTSTPQAEAKPDNQTETSQGRTEIVEYTVVQGDTLSDIAQRFGVSVESILWASKLSNGDLLSIGDKLTVPPVSGVVHTVQSGDTIEGIAARYKVELSAIVDYASNGLTNPNALSIGQQIVVPGGKVIPPARVVTVNRGEERAVAQSPAADAGSGGKASAAGFAWPTRGPIFTYFSSAHEGIDISPPYGTPVYAAAGGRVVEMRKLGWSYGWYIILDHGNGFQTMYAHLSRFEVDAGEDVQQGQLIGRVGTTGKVTGPHLHFEVHRNGVPVNPLTYLP